jgi:hypothetical protein
VLGVQDFKSLVLIDALSSACWEKIKERKKKEKKKEMAGCFFFFFFNTQGRTCLAGCAVQDFHGCYVQLKANLKVCF